MMYLPHCMYPIVHVTFKLVNCLKRKKKKKTGEKLSFQPTVAHMKTWWGEAHKPPLLITLDTSLQKQQLGDQL